MLPAFSLRHGGVPKTLRLTHDGAGNRVPLLHSRANPIKTMTAFIDGFKSAFTWYGLGQTLGLLCILLLILGAIWLLDKILS